MTEISKIDRKFVGAGAADSSRTPVSGYGVFNPVVRSAVGIVRESAGLVINIAGLGAALICETKAAQPARRTSVEVQAFARHGNVIPFPISRKRNSN